MDHRRDERNARIYSSKAARIKFVVFALIPVFIISCLSIPYARASAGSQALSTEDNEYFKNLAGDTYNCIDFYVDPKTGLPADNTKRSGESYTSVTNIGLYMAVLAGACELGLEDKGDASKKIKKIMRTMDQAKTWSNFPYNWINIRTLQVREEFVSSVDLGNYFAGIIVARQYFPELRKDADRLLADLDFNLLYDKQKKFLYHGYNTKSHVYTQWHYDLLGSESRLAYLVGIAVGGLPPQSWNLQVKNLEYRYGIEYLKPGWQGGGMFLGFMAGLFINEQGTLPGLSAGNLAKAQMIHMKNINSGVWGWSASNSPLYGYLGFENIRDDVVAPYASVLAVSLFPGEVIANLRKLEELGVRPRQLEDGIYHNFGFRDAYDIKTSMVTDNYLMLDQSMLFLSLTNFLTDGFVNGLFESYPPVKNALSEINKYSDLSSGKTVFPVNLSKKYGLSASRYEEK